MSSTLGLGRPHSGKSTKHPRQSSGNYTAVFDPAQVRARDLHHTRIKRVLGTWYYFADMSVIIIASNVQGSFQREIVIEF